MRRVVVVGIPEVTEIYHVEQSTVRVWRTRDDLPEPALVFGREPAWEIKSVTRLDRRSNAATADPQVVKRLEAERGFDGPVVLLGMEHFARLTGRTVSAIRHLNSGGGLPAPDLRIGSKIHKPDDPDAPRGTPVWRLATATLFVNGELAVKPPRGLKIDSRALLELQETNRIA